MVSIEILISLHLRGVYSLFISFVFPSLRKSISVKENYKASWAILSRGRIETSAVFFSSVMNDQGVLANLESLTNKYVRTDLNRITKIFSSEK